MNYIQLSMLNKEERMAKDNYHPAPERCRMIIILYINVHKQDHQEMLF